MNPDENEIKELVRQAIALGQENNIILKKMQKSARLSTFFRICYWILIVALSFGAFYFIQPYVNSLQQAVSGSFGDSSTPAASATPSGPENTAQDLNNLLKSL